jgi:hypothetical protein
MSASQLNRVAAMVGLVEGAKTSIGRTALMKLCFFLQVLRGVPLGYEFTLYSYGPFDSDVMADLQTAEGLAALRSNTVMYPGGYGYAISPGKQAEEVKKYSKLFLTKYSSEIDWVGSTFGRYNASELELISTALFVSIKEPKSSNQEIAEKVLAIKPHFSITRITSKVDWLEHSGFLRRGEL